MILPFKFRMFADDEMNLMLQIGLVEMSPIGIAKMYFTSE